MTPTARLAPRSRSALSLRSIHASQLTCMDASRRLRGGPVRAAASRFETHRRARRARGAASCASRCDAPQHEGRSRASLAGDAPHSRSRCQTALQTAHLVPAARCARVVNLCPPREGWRSADRRPDAALSTRLGLHHDAARRAFARRPASHDAGRAPFGAPPWRFLAVGRASVCGIILRSPCSELLAAKS